MLADTRWSMDVLLRMLLAERIVSTCKQLIHKATTNKNPTQRNDVNRSQVQVQS